MAEQGWRPSRRQILKGAAVFGAGAGFTLWAAPVRAQDKLVMAYGGGT